MRASSETLSPRALLAFALLALACAKVGANGAGTGGVGAAGLGDGGATVVGGATGIGGDTGTGGATSTGGATGAGGDPFAPPCTTACTDFPTDPFLDPNVPADAPAMFTGAAVGAGPCVTEPEDGALFPDNWLRPRVKFTPLVAGTLHEIRFHADKEANDIVAYTTSDSWTMPKTVWTKVAFYVRDAPITVTVRALGGGATSVKFRVAPVAAPGSIVYWAADPAELGTQQAMNSNLQGFAVGDESTTTVLGVPDVQMQTRDANNALRSVKCIGCHNSTPDGASVGFVDLYPWNIALAGVKPGTTGKVPTYLTDGGKDTIRQPGMGIFSFSKAHWTDGDRIAVSPYYLTAPCTAYKQDQSNVRLAWLDLQAPAVANGCPVEGTHFGIIARTGDTRGAANPTWSPDGNTIVYSSVTKGQDGRLDAGPSDLFQVPYNNRAGGDATALPGASDPAFDEYYPAFSPDSKLVVFDRVPVGGSMYANALAELFVVRADGTTPMPQRLRANDPPKCSGQVSPGVNNHWAKWAPSATTGPDGRTYYWIIFSSNRFGTPPVSAGGAMVQVSQLYATAIVADENGLEMFPAIYLWNQHTDHLNTTPAWDAFQIPIIP